MATDAVQTMFEEACLRLFALHADGYKRPKPAVRSGSRPSAAPRVRSAQRGGRVQSII